MTLILTLGGGVISPSQAVAVAVIHDVNVAINDVIAWPNLTRLPDGSMLLAGFDQPSHLKTEGDVGCWVSTDEGDTWTFRATVSEHAPMTARSNHALGLDQNNELVALVGGWTDDYEGVGETTDHGTFRAAILRPTIHRSTDNGVTWTLTGELPTDPLGRELIPYGDILQSANGRLNTVAYSTNYWGLPGAWKVFMITSDDDGASWVVRSEIVEGRNETTLLQVGPSEWLVAARGNGLVQYRSVDDGLTWQSEGAVTAKGQHPGHLLRLADGSILLSYGDRNAGSLGVWGKLSYDQGQTWQAPTFLGTMPSTDGGYPVSLERPDGKIVTVYYSSEGTYTIKRVLWSTESRCLITSPTDGAGVLSTNTLTLSAAAPDGNGTLTDITFYQGTSSLGEVTTAPYTYEWVNPPVGVYDLTAVATYSDNSTVTSPVVSVSVLPAGTPLGILYTGEGDSTDAADQITGDGAQNGVLVGSATVSSNAAFGTQAYTFGPNDNTPDGIDIPNSKTLGSAFTLSAFVRSTATDDKFYRLFSDFLSSYKLIFDFSPTSTTIPHMRLIVNGVVTVQADAAAGNYNDGEYHHLAATYDDGVVNLYLDGVNIGSGGTAGKGDVTLGNNLRVGEDLASSNSDSEQLVGDVDDILVLKNALSAAEVANLSSVGAVNYLAGVIPPAPVTPAVDIGIRREIFMDYSLIDSMNNAELVRQTPVDEGVVLQFDQPWEGFATVYSTVIKDGDTYRMYYRGQPTESVADASTCYAESTDGINWVRPNLGLHTVQGTSDNNVILTAADRNDSFAPFLDTSPDALPSERFKATATGSGSPVNTMVGYTSADGINWTNTLGTIMTGAQFDSLNVAFYSEAEEQYVCYFRRWVDGIRRIGRATSPDFGALVDQGMMEYDYPNGGDPGVYQDHYVSGTHPYDRAPHQYIALAADLYGADSSSDALLMSSRAGSMVYDRLFPERYIVPAPEIGTQILRSNFPTQNTVQTGPRELSFYVGHKYRDVSNHLRRYSLRLDGFVAASTTAGVGELVTKPIIFSGNQLRLNYLTRAEGSVKVEIQGSDGVPLAGFALADAVPLSGDEVDGTVAWSSTDVSALAGTVVKLRFVLENADLFAYTFDSLIQNQPATDVLDTSASLNALLDESATVRVSWGSEANASNAVWDHQQNLGALSAGPLTFGAVDLSPDSSYAYTFGFDNGSGFSDATTIERFSTAFAAEHAPTNLTAVSSDTLSIEVQWTDRSQTESGFRVERNDGTGWVLDQLTLADVTQVISSDLSPGTHYDYRVQAVHDWAESAYSNVDGADTGIPPVPIMKQILLTAEGDTTNAVDQLLSDGAQDGTFSGDVAVSSTNATFGAQAYAFTGTGAGHVIDIADSSVLGEAFTLAAFIDTSDSTKLQRLFSTYSGAGGVPTNVLLMDVDPDNTIASDLGLRLFVNGTYVRVTLPAAATDGLYHHYAATYSNGEVKLYFDGELLKSGTAGSGSLTLNANLRFGEDLAGGTANENFVGDADDILVIGRALSVTEMAQLSQLGAVAFFYDADGDGIADAWEEQYGGSHLFATGQDYDSDGVTDDAEYIAGTNPTLQSSLFRVDQIENVSSEITLTWPSSAGRIYDIYALNDLAAPTPTLVLGDIAATPPNNQQTIPIDVDKTAQFYQVHVRLP